MRIRAGCDIMMKMQGPTPIIAMLRPRSGRAQWIASESYLLDPFVPAVEYTDAYGNLCQRFVAAAGSFRVRVEAVVETADTLDRSPGAPRTAIEDVPDTVLQFLLPSRFCLSDCVEDRAKSIVKGKAPGYDEVEAICKWVHENIKYKYGVSTATTTAVDTLKEGAGVCRDFSHVSLSLCRSLQIPGRMVVGYLYRLEPMDLHAWFEAYINGRWYTFDATQAEPRVGRVALAYGRDAADVALTTEYGPIEIAAMKVWVEPATAVS